MNVECGIYDQPDVTGLGSCGRRCGAAGVRVPSSPWEDAPKMVVPVGCSTWSPSARRVTRMEAQPRMRVPYWVPDESVKKMMLVSLRMSRRAISVGWWM